MPSRNTASCNSNTSSATFVFRFHCWPPCPDKQRKLYFVSSNDLDEDKDMTESTPSASYKMAANSHIWSRVIVSQPAGGQVRQTPLYWIGNRLTPLQFLDPGWGNEGHDSELQQPSSSVHDIGMRWDNDSWLTLAGGLGCRNSDGRDSWGF